VMQFLLVFENNPSKKKEKNFPGLDCNIWSNQTFEEITKETSCQKSIQRCRTRLVYLLEGQKGLFNRLSQSMRFFGEQNTIVNY